MKYLASNELIEIFLSNGFEDITESVYPDHFKRFVESGYNPKTMKRALGYGNSCRIEMSYSKIVPRYKDNTKGTEMREELTEDELKSIITFCKLPTQTRSAYRRQSQDITDLHKMYKSIKEHPEFYKDKGSKALVEVFERINID